MVTPCFSARGRSVSVASSASEGEIDVFWGEGLLVGAAEEEQCLREVDRCGVEAVEAVDEFAVLAVGIVAGHVEKRLGDREWGA